ncbi:hypothetical protein AFE02nite_12970 [Actinotalea fermentans]|uniref:Uncharacterized protein n=1 Tax=Actinotalea fermentans TaxID=43671 RepID=A0A511YWH1_9CELL|nr:hypothetical protein AFE02nite_12970 [Actinotalea fermentans]
MTTKAEKSSSETARRSRGAIRSADGGDAGAGCADETGGVAEGAPVGAVARGASAVRACSVIGVPGCLCWVGARRRADASVDRRPGVVDRFCTGN